MKNVKNIGYYEKQEKHKKGGVNFVFNLSIKAFANITDGYSNDNFISQVIN